MGFFRVRFGEGLRLSLMAAMGLVCAATGNGAAAQAKGAAPVAKTTLVEPPTQLLPQRFGAWQQVKSDTDGNLAASYDGHIEMLLKEDGLQRFGSSTYKRDGSGETVPMKAFQFFDATGAVAAYTYFRSPESRLAPQLRLGDDASIDARGLLFREGATVVITDFKEGLRAGDLAALEAVLPKPIGTTGISPLLPTLLPAKGLDAATVRYALGPVGYQAMGGGLPAAEVVGFDKSAEAVTAKYKSGGLLTLMLYPTPQIAGEHLREVESAMRGQVAASDQAKSAVGTVMMRREGPLVILTTGAWTAADAQKMVNGIHLHSEVSFDKPMPLEFHAEVQKTYSLLTSIAVFCGVGAAAAVILGLFLGGGRAAIRVMMGKPAASEPEFLRIDLHGTGTKRLGDPKA